MNNVDKLIEQGAELARKHEEIRDEILNNPDTFEIEYDKEDISDWDATLQDGLESIPYVSDDFQIGPDGAYEHTNEHEIISVQKQLIDLLYSQVVDLTLMSKIELGDDVIEEIKRLKQLINEQSR